VITNSRKAADALIWAVTEMERRYELFADVGVRNIAGYHKRFENSKVKTYKNKRGEEEPLEKVPYIVIIIDELADLMMTVAQDVEESQFL
jgi:S-DNA-T family DNA segregation ATPase FtsK/SpoIIIE